MARQRLIAIGDIHGCIHALDTILGEIAPTSEDQIVILGDVIDGGRESQLVIERLIRLHTECEMVYIRGNHEEMMLEALANPAMKQHWLELGGIDTLNSYKYLGDFSDVPVEHLNFLRSSLDYFETDDFFFTHAGYLPELPLAEQPSHSLRWALLEPPYPSPHYTGKTAVVGHTEQKSGEILDLGYLKCIDTACVNYGWLTAHDVRNSTTWQASKWGQMREVNEQLAGQQRAKEILRRQLRIDHPLT